MNVALLVFTLLATAPEPAPPPPSQPPDGARVVIEVMAGVAGELVLLLPGAYAGWMVGDSLADMRQCDSVSDFNRRAECRESIQSDSRGRGLWVGMSLGFGLGSVMGVSIAGSLMNAQGGIPAAILLGLGGSALGLLLPVPWLSAGLALLGSVLGYELGRAPPATAAARPQPSLHFTPVVRITDHGGLVGVTGRF